MVTLTRNRMARSAGGRPRKGDETGGTQSVRLFDDVAEMIGWIVELKGGSSAKLLDPLIRKHVESEYATIAREVEVIKKARAKHRPGSGVATD